jgi:hypothetical protein
MISFHDSCWDDDEAEADVRAEAQQKFSVPSVPQCSVPMEQKKRLQVVVFKGVFLLYIYLFHCSTIYHTPTEIFYRLTVLTS